MAKDFQYPAELVKEVMRLHRWNWTHREVAQGLGLSLGKVARIIKANEKKKERVE